MAFMQGFTMRPELEQDATQVGQCAAEMHDKTRPLGAVDHAMVV
jgi:hypothetical protein